MSASVAKMLRLLFFRIQKMEMSSFDSSDLKIGLIFTWFVGIGRYWDDPGALWAQHLGIGSLVYIFVLSFFIWLLLRPFQIVEWTYRHVLTFVSLTSAPALLYAIPVERFFAVDTAAAINAYFLLTVAAWRVALLIFYLRRFAQISRLEALVTTLLPLTVIVTALTLLNLERAVFDIMGGLRESTSNDSAYLILNLLTALSMLIVGPVCIVYGIICYEKLRDAKSLKWRPNE